MARGDRAPVGLRQVDRGGRGGGGDAAGHSPGLGRQEPETRAEALDVHLPTGAPLVGADDVAFASGERVLVTGPSGSGKSTLFRAIGGIWPFGSGTVAI